jgi:hypothetical protein
LGRPVRVASRTAKSATGAVRFEVGFLRTAATGPPFSSLLVNYGRCRR